MSLLPACTVLMPSGGVCRNPKRNGGLLSSVVSAETSCGSPTTPWMIDVDPGQRVNITLIDFGLPPGVNNVNTSVTASRTHCQVSTVDVATPGLENCTEKT